jgi:hypothetical protein
VKNTENQPLNDHKIWIKDLLQEQEEDRALFSRLKDELEGCDSETDDLLREIDRLELEIIQELSKEVLNG